MASQGHRQVQARQGSPRALLAVLAAAAIVAAALFWQLNRETSPEADNPAAGAPPAQMQDRS